MSKLSKHRRRFTQEERLEIFREAELGGLEPTLRKHNISRSLNYQWKPKFDSSGTDGLRDIYHKIDPAAKMLDKEIRMRIKVSGKSI